MKSTALHRRLSIQLVGAAGVATAALAWHAGARAQKTSAALLVADGREISPIRWTGAQPGGHHREGVLTFPAPGQAATSIELRLQRANETAPRVFRWDGAALHVSTGLES